MRRKLPPPPPRHASQEDWEKEDFTPVLPSTAADKDKPAEPTFEDEDAEPESTSAKEHTIKPQVGFAAAAQRQAALSWAPRSAELRYVSGRRLVHRSWQQRR